jgi:hypothetical protein
VCTDIGGGGCIPLPTSLRAHLPGLRLRPLGRRRRLNLYVAILLNVISDELALLEVDACNNIIQLRPRSRSH